MVPVYDCEGRIVGYVTEEGATNTTIEEVLKNADFLIDNRKKEKKPEPTEYEIWLDILSNSKNINIVENSEETEFEKGCIEFIYYKGDFYTRKILMTNEGTIEIEEIK